MWIYQYCAFVDFQQNTLFFLTAWLSSLFQVNYKMQMNFRRMFNDRKHHKRSKRGASNKVEYA